MQRCLPDVILRWTVGMSVVPFELTSNVTVLVFERAAKTKECEVQALIEHARMLVSTRDYDQAIRYLQEVQVLDPQPRIDRYLKSIQNLLISSRIQL